MIDATYRLDQSAMDIVNSDHERLSFIYSVVTSVLYPERIVSHR